MNCIYEGELKWDTASSFQSFHFSFHFPSGPSQVQEAQMTCQKGSDLKEISNPGKAENQLLENQSILLWSVKENWLVKYWCGIHEKRGVATWNTQNKVFPGYKEYYPEYLACINPKKQRCWQWCLNEYRESFSTPLLTDVFSFQHSVSTQAGESLNVRRDPVLEMKMSVWA